MEATWLCNLKESQQERTPGTQVCWLFRFQGTQDTKLGKFGLMDMENIKSEQDLHIDFVL